MLGEGEPSAACDVGLEGEGASFLGGEFVKNVHGFGGERLGELVKNLLAEGVGVGVGEGLFEGGGDFLAFAAEEGETHGIEFGGNFLDFEIEVDEAAGGLLEVGAEFFAEGFGGVVGGGIGADEDLELESFLVVLIPGGDTSAKIADARGGALVLFWGRIFSGVEHAFPGEEGAVGVAEDFEAIGDFDESFGVFFGEGGVFVEFGSLVEIAELVAEFGFSV